MHASPGAVDPLSPDRRRPSAERHARPGQTVADRYRVRDIIGRGGWSVVYDATHLGTDQRVALKMLLSGLPCGDDKAEARFAREAKITANLRHPNTVRVFDFGRTTEGVLWHASEFLEGPSLADVLEAREVAGRFMTPLEAFAIADPVLRSLNEAHGKGLVHRDLKPENIVITEVAGERVVKVLDFGIAWLRGQKLTRRGISLGSPFYMSPEQCARQDLDGRSDLYALSVVLYRCVTGELPFEDDDPLVVLEQHRSQQPPDPRSQTRQPLPDAFVDCLMRGLAKHPKQRFADAADMRSELQTAIGVPARPEIHAMATPLAAIPRGSEPGSETRFLRFADLPTPAGLAGSAQTQSTTPKIKTTAKYGAVTADALAALGHHAPALSEPEPAPQTPTEDPALQPSSSRRRSRAHMWPAVLAAAAALLIGALALFGGSTAAAPTPSVDPPAHTSR